MTVVRWSALIGPSGKTSIYDFPVMDYFFPVNANRKIGLDTKDKKILASVGFTLVHIDVIIPACILSALPLTFVSER